MCAFPVCDGMVRLRPADFRIRAIAQLARQLKRDDPCDVGLERQDLQVEHERRVIGERRRNALRSIQIGDGTVRRRGFGALNLTFDRDGHIRTCYSMRHTYICLRLLDGADIYQVAKNCRTSVEMIDE